MHLKTCARGAVDETGRPREEGRERGRKRGEEMHLSCKGEEEVEQTGEGGEEEKKETACRLVDGQRSRRRSPEVPAGGQSQTSNK